MAARTIALILMVLVPLTTWAKTAPRLVVLPFAVHSREDFTYLQKNLPSLVEKQLKMEGAEIVKLPPETLAGLVRPGRGLPTVQEARTIARELFADYAVLGSISKIVNTVSMDVTLVSSQEGQEPFSFYQEGMGMENLPGLIEKLAQKVGLVIFGKQKVVAVEVSGNKRIEKSAILAVVKTKPGEVYSLKTLDRDLKAIYAMGYFEDVSINAVDVPGGKKVQFVVVEKPSVKKVLITGNKKIKTDDALEALNIKPYSILNLDKITAGIEAIKDLYRKEGYLNVKISYTLEPDQDRTVILALKVEEGKKAYIKKIRFTGNKAFSDKELKKRMETSEKGLLYWLLDSGKLDRAKLRNDIDRISSFYFNHGYIRAKVGEPEVEVKEDSIYITIPIQEGPRYNVGRVDLQGDFVKPSEELAKVLSVKPGIVYNRELVRKDIMNLRDIYADYGYAYAEISPLVKIDDEKRLVNISYNIKKGNKIYFERITIAGNTKTRDKVIRRELEVVEGGLFSSKKLRKSSEKLHRLDFFESIDITTSRGSADDKLNLKIEVTEKKTGNFSIGAGYSSVDGLIGMFDISQRNFLGRGQRLSLSGQIGGRNQRFSLLFNEPWLFDIPLSTTFEVYNWVRNYRDYDKDAIGGSVRVSYPLWRHLRGSLKYRYERAKVTNISEDASQVIKDQEGKSTTSSITAGLRWDTRDRVFLTTKGMDHYLTVEHAGTPLGGSNAFTKYIFGTAWFFPLFWGTVGHIRAKIGYITENKEDGLPLYEKFYLGGINSLRGFERYDVSPKDPITGDRVGGTKMLLLNVEYRFPLVKKAGFYGLVFFDTGNVYADSDNYDLSNLRRSAGVGIRWYSPMGPLSVDFGVNLSPEPGEDRTVFDFSLGGSFY